MLLLLLFAYFLLSISAFEWQLIDGVLTASENVLLVSGSDASTSTAPLLRLHSNGSSILELEVGSQQASILKAISEGVVTFELSSSGLLTTNGIRMKTGGVYIDSGGLRIDAGGLRVKGGLTIESGGLHMDNQKVEVKSADKMMPLFVGYASSPDFVGDMIRMDSDSSLDFNFMSMKNKAKEHVFSVTSRGTCKSVHVNTQTIALSHISIDANDQIIIPSTATYVEIMDDGLSKRNVLVLPDMDVQAGRVLFISNTDQDMTSGPFYIPTNTSIMLLFNGDAWRPVDALKAPVESLDGVKSITAMNDLNFGNFTLEAGAFKASRLKRDSIVYVGKDGLLESADSVKLSKGSLTAREVHIQQAFIEQIHSTGGNVQVDSLTLPGLHGLAAFNSGALSVASSIKLDEQGRIVLTDFHNDIDLHSHSVLNANMKGGHLANIKEASINSLVLPSCTPRSFLTLDLDYRVVPVEGISFIKGELRVSSIGAFKATGPIDFNGESLSNVMVKSGYISNADAVSSRSFRFTSYSTDVSNASRLLLVDARGELLPMRAGESLRLYDVSLASLDLSGDLQLHDSRISGCKVIESESGNFDDISVSSLRLEGFQSAKLCGNGCLVMGAGTDGRVAPLDISNLIKDALDSNIEFDTLSAARASLKNVEASVVETDSLKLPNLRKTLLSTDSTGLVVAAEDVSVGTLMAVTASVKELTVSSLTLKVLARKGPTTSILSVSSDGVVEIVDDISIKKLSVMESKMEKLVVNALEVAGAVDVRAIAAKELKVTGQSQFHDDIFVRGSVSVEGSVIGSGPYVDSSDRRFKTNVVQMTDALDKLCSMQAVSSPRRIEALQSMTNITQVYFDYDAEGFPSRNFPTERQVGWMADEVKENFPELVVEDVSGFQSVAYARSTAVIAEAVKELRRETDDKLSKILEELVSIRNEISDIKEKMKGGVR